MHRGGTLPDSFAMPPMQDAVSRGQLQQQQHPAERVQPVPDQRGGVGQRRPPAGVCRL